VGAGGGGQEAGSLGKWKKCNTFNGKGPLPRKSGTANKGHGNHTIN